MFILKVNETPFHSLHHVIGCLISGMQYHSLSARVRCLLYSCVTYEAEMMSMQLDDLLSVLYQFLIVSTDDVNVPYFNLYTKHQ